jgi:hypothetical protein
VVFDHALDVEFLDCNHTVSIDQPSGGLVNEIMATVTNALMDTGNNLFGFLSLTAPALLSCEFALCFCQCLFFCTKEARIFDVLTVGQRHKGLQANVNANLFIRRRKQFGADFAGKAGVPLMANTANGTRLDVAVNGAVLTNGDIANLGQSQFALVEAKAALGVGERILAVPLDTGKAWGLTRLNPTEKGVKSKVNANGDVLQDLAVDIGQFRVFLFPLWERGLLLYFGRRLAQYVVVVLAPVQEAVVDLLTGFQRLCQGRLLRLCRIGTENIGQAIFRCAFGFQYTV